MELKNVKASLPFLLKTNIVPLLIGEAGVGKTEIVKQFCDENEYFFKTINLGTLCDSGDLLGLANFLKNKNGDDIATRFITPDWINEILDYANNNPESRSIIFLDEVNRAHRDILQAVFSLMLEKRIHTLQFPDNVNIIAAMNPNTGDYITTDISDKAFLGRFCHIKVKPSVEEWISYAKATDHDVDLVGFIQNQPDLLDSKGEDFSLEDIKPSRRKISALSRLLKSSPPAELIRDLMSGLIGIEATVAYEEYLKNAEKPLAASEILNNYNEKNLEVVRGYVTSNRFDLLKKTMDFLSQELKDIKEVTAAQYDNLKKFIYNIPNEHSFSFTYDVAIYDSLAPLMMYDEEFTDHIAKVKGTLPKESSDDK